MKQPDPIDIFIVGADQIFGTTTVTPMDVRCFIKFQ
jgi:hypothetical protein